MLVDGRAREGLWMLSNCKVGTHKGFVSKAELEFSACVVYRHLPPPTSRPVAGDTCRGAVVSVQVAGEEVLK